MEAAFKKVEKQLPCRREIIKILLELVGRAEESFPSAIYLYGHSGTGKTSIVKNIFQQLSRVKNLYTVLINCVECYTPKILFENILNELTENVGTLVRCDGLKEFIEGLRRLSLNKEKEGIIIALDKSERLRDMDTNILTSLLKLQEYSGLNVTVILISQLPFEKYLCKTGLSDLTIIYCPQYSKAETFRILCADFENVQKLLRARLKEHHVDNEEELLRKLQIVNTMTLDFFNNYLNVCLSVFYKACRDVPELKLTARKCFFTYIEPVLDGSVDPSDVSRLWRHIANTLKELLTQVYMRYDQEQTFLDESETTLPVQLNLNLGKLAQSVELPYYAKYLLIAAFLASYNSAKSDKRLFVKHHGKQKKRVQTVNAKTKTIDKMATSLGPKSFSIDRLLAIFYAILDEKVGLSCNLLSQISTLVHLKLLSFVSGESNIMDGSARLQCTVSLEFVVHIGKVVGFNVQQYLCDFI